MPSGSPVRFIMQSKHKGLWQRLQCPKYDLRPQSAQTSCLTGDSLIFLMKVVNIIGRRTLIFIYVKNSYVSRFSRAVSKIIQGLMSRIILENNRLNLGILMGVRVYVQGFIRFMDPLGN